MITGVLLPSPLALQVLRNEIVLLLAVLTESNQAFPLAAPLYVVAPNAYLVCVVYRAATLYIGLHQEIQKIVAFEGAFERLLELVGPTAGLRSTHRTAWPL